jgi:hypothetical protein
MVIGIEKERKKQYDKDVADKQRLLDQAIQLTETLITIENEDKFKESFTTYFLEQWSEQYKNSFPPFVKVEKQIELSDFSLTMLHQLETKYKAIRLPENPNFDITITKEQIVVYKALKQVCDAINSSVEHVPNLLLGQIVATYKGGLSYSFEKKQLEVNPLYFNRNYHRA